MVTGKFPRYRRLGELYLCHTFQPLEMEGASLQADIRPATFQRLMEQVLYGLHWKLLLIHLDNVIVISPDFDCHLHNLEEVFRRLQDAKTQASQGQTSARRSPLSSI